MPLPFFEHRTVLHVGSAASGTSSLTRGLKLLGPLAQGAELGLR